MKSKSSTKDPLANLTFDEMSVAIPKLDKVIESLKTFDINTVTSGIEPQIMALSQSISRIITRTFGNDTHEYRQYHSFAELAYLSLSRFDTPSDIRGVVKNKIEHAISTLESIKQSFLEELEDSGKLGAGVKAIKAYEGLNLHPNIAEAVNALFFDGHYANAVEDSVKALSNLVRLKSGLTDDGVPLMQRAFSPKQPILQFNMKEDKSDEDEQKGFMEWFTGTVSGLRNPRAHKIIKDHPEMALEFIAFVSLLAKLVDKAMINNENK